MNLAKPRRDALEQRQIVCRRLGKNSVVEDVAWKLVALHVVADTLPSGYPHSEIPDLFVLARSFTISTRSSIGRDAASLVQLDAFLNGPVEL